MNRSCSTLPISHLTSDNIGSPAMGDFIEVKLTNPSYLKVYDFEHLDLTWWRKWFGDNWMLSVYASAIYVVLIFWAQAWMKNRPAYDLKWPLTIWNASLAIFSIIGFSRSLPEFVHVMFGPDGYNKYLCTREEHTSPTAFWGLIFMMSKLLELGDTAFIILKKRPLIFLHWFHHATVFMFCWYVYEFYEPPIKFYALVNFFIHGLMYSYFAMMSMGIKIPKNLAMTITILQISQMVFGITVNVYSLWSKGSGFECQIDNKNSILAISMYASYFILFAIFFRDAYGKKNSADKKSSS